MQFLDNSQVDDLIVGFLKNELSDEEIVKLTTWIRQHEDNKHYFDEYREIWLTSLAINYPTKFRPEIGFEKFLENVDDDNSTVFLLSKKWFRYAGVAAIFILTFLLGGIIFSKFMYSNRIATGKEYSEIIVPRGAKAHFVLMDGTIVTLNAGSKLRYNSLYGVKDRVVELEGEGYFKVAKNKNKPFIVKTSFLNVRALGTEFNVKAYGSDRTIETTLVEGSVEVERNNKNSNSDKVILVPNQKLTYYKDKEFLKQEEGSSDENKKDNSGEIVIEEPQTARELVKEDVMVEPLISWKENRWIIDKLDLSKFAVELERKFDIQINFGSERLKSFRFTGTFLNEPLEQVLKVMSITAPINYEIKGRKVTLTEKEDFERIYKKLYENNK